MKKLIIGFLLGALFFGGATLARETLVDFSKDSISIFNDMIRRIWFAIDDETIRGSTPFLEWHDIDNNKSYMVHVDFEGTEDWTWALYEGVNLEGSTFDVHSTRRKPIIGITSTGGIILPYIASGNTQALAGAVTGEIWADADDSYSLKLGQ